jgi:hypothetical protein
VFITAVPITKLFAREGGGEVEDMCYERHQAMSKKEMRLGKVSFMSRLKMVGANVPRILKPKIARARGSCGPPRNCIRNWDGWVVCEVRGEYRV